MLRPVLLTALVIFALCSCEFKNEEELVGSNCDTLNVTYFTVKPVFEKNCVSCHNDQVFNQNIKLNTFENASNAAKTGLLKKAVNHEAGVTPMPYEQLQLPPCEVRKITLWIEKGSPQK